MRHRRTTAAGLNPASETGSPITEKTHEHGLIGGLAIGALAAGAAAGPYGECYVTHQPVYDAYGDFMGYRPVRVCD